MTSLTDFTLKNLPIPERGQITHHDAGSPLKVRVSQGGAKTFLVTLGSGRRYTIGRYGEVTLSQAREAARRLRAEQTLGRILPSTISVSAASGTYLGTITVRKNTRLYYTRYLGYLSGKLVDVSARDINRILDPLSVSCRRQGLRTYATFFNWCIRKHYLEKSPCDRMQAPSPPSRGRVLTDDELKAIWHFVGSMGTYGTIIRLLILTGQRSNEIAKLCREPAPKI